MKKAEETGNAEFVFECPAVQLVQDESGKVTGAICERKDGTYVQYNAPKGVVLATGDVSYNDEYLEEFAPIALKVMTRLCSDQGNVGDGHNMAAWVGGTFQDGPWPTMMHPQAAASYHGPFLFINPDGKRFMNEATWVQGKCIGVMVNGGYDHAWSIFDANFEADIHRQPAVRRRHVLGQLPCGGVQTYADGGLRRMRRPWRSGVTENPDNYKKRRHAWTSWRSILDVAKADVAKQTIERYNEIVRRRAKTPISTRSPTTFIPSRRVPSMACKVASRPARRRAAAFTSRITSRS